MPNETDTQSSIQGRPGQAATSAPPQHGGSTPKSFSKFDGLLFALTVFAWSASWYAISLQPGLVANEVSLVYRFAIAFIIMFAWAALSGRQLRFALKDHAAFAVLGVLIFSTNFLLFYYGSQYLVSGLLSVLFSLASVFNVLLATLILQEPLSKKTIVAGLIGFGGIALMFWPEITKNGVDANVLTGVALCISGTLFFCFGNMMSMRLQRRAIKIPLVSMNAWGMAYGCGWAALLALLQGKEFIYDPRPEYTVSLLFLAIISTVLAFAAYLTLIGRVGAGRAGYATVIFPIFALAISTYAEGYVWTLAAIAGLGMVIVGNIIVMRG